jgi:DNA-binding MarR family transcriptional regulator
VAQDNRPEAKLPSQHEQTFMLDGVNRTAVGAGDEADTHAAGLQVTRWWLNARRLREEVFGPGLFADPVWDILLDLYSAEDKGECVQISSLAIAARVPHSTAVRWAKIMTHEGLMVRHRDPTDARRIHVRLSPFARSLMQDYFTRLTGRAPVAPQFIFEPSS